jgi:MerR family transcriptional regulator, redox-sensitive transcriptional activator SoxR
MESAARIADGMSIGTVARMAGLEVSAIRYYESVGLIPPPRRVSGKRVYDTAVFESIALVQLAQDAGFTLAEARALVSGFEKSTPASARWQAMARKKLVDVTERIERAEQMKAILEKLLRCKCQTLGQCVRSRTEALRTAAEFSRGGKRL